MRHLTAIAALLLLLSACATGLPLKTNELETLPNGMEQLYTLIYFVGVDHSDVRRAVILDMEDDGYEFRPDVIDFQYEILQNVSLPESVYETEVFFRQEGVVGYKKSTILSLDDNIIGYEFRPQYNKNFMGVEDLMNMSYELAEDNTIHINIKVKKSMKKLFYKY